MSDRLRAEHRGRRAETLCALLLRLKGYRVIARRLKTPMGEIDIIARRGDTLAVIEVKSREEWAPAMEAVTARQRGRLVRAARAFLAVEPRYAGFTIRFDVMLVRPWRLPRHLVDAWRA